MSTLVTTALRHNTSASNNIVLDSSGRVGIGTSAVNNNSILEVAGSTFSRIAVTETSSNVIAQVATNTADAILGSLSNHPIAFRVNNTERMRIDTSGRVTVPNQPMFWGVHNSVVTYNVGNLIQITAAYDPNSMFSGASNYRVTVPIAGRYLVSASLLLNSGSAGAFSVNIRKNGVAVRRIFSNQGYGYQHGSDTIIINCAANDYIDLAAADNTQTIYGGDIGSFVVYLIG